jgi:hypothetical protein
LGYLNRRFIDRLAILSALFEEVCTNEWRED